jgi:Fe2+ or Zn2+ uptake regulation protein
MRTSDALGAALDRAGYAVTAPRRAVADLVQQRDGHFTALDLLAEAKRRRLGVGRATVFRALELFEELGLVERLDLPNGEHAYVVCEPAHHHHVVCQRCGRDAEIEDCGIDALATAIESSTGYLVDLHRIEFFGLCPACLSLGDAAPRPAPHAL